MMKKLLKNKKGATLVELTIVMALVGIVVSMVCVFLTGMQTSIYRISDKTEWEDEMNSIQTIVNDWVKEHDNVYYTFKADDPDEGFAEDDPHYRRLFAEASGGGNLSSWITFDTKTGLLTISYANPTNASVVYREPTNYQFDRVRHFYFAVKRGNPTATATPDEGQAASTQQTNEARLNNLVVCTVELEDKVLDEVTGQYVNDTQDMLFVVFSGTVRDRYSPIAKMLNED